MRLGQHLWRGRTTHPTGKPMGLSLPDLAVTAEPAAYLGERRKARRPMLLLMAARSRSSTTTSR